MNLHANATKVTFHFFKNLIFTVSLFLSFFSCQKDKKDALPEVKNEQVKSRFFTLPENTDKIVCAIANKIEKDNQQQNIINGLIKKVGYPFWDKSFVITKNFAIDEDEPHRATSLVYIPFGRESDNFINAVLIVKTDQKDTVFKMLYDWQYANYSFESNNTLNLWTAKDIFNIFTSFDREIFGTEEYRIIDRRLFRLQYSTEEIVVKIIKDTTVQSTTSSSRMTPITACQLIAVYGPCNQRSLNREATLMPPCISHYETICTTYWIEMGSGADAGTGGGNGGNSSLTDPCSGASQGNVARLPSPAPCSGNPGWVPVENSYSGTVTFLTNVLGLSTVQKNWLLNNSAVGNTINTAIIENGLSDETKSASLITIEAARSNLVQGPYNATHYNKIQTYIPNAGSYSAATMNPIYWIHFMAQCAMIRADHPEWSSWRVYWEATSEIIHTGLDIIGLIPVVGEIADLTNGVLYTIQGDGVNASLSFAATLPIAGWLSTTAKYAKKTIFALDGSKRTLQWLKIGTDKIGFGDRSLLRKVLGIKDSRVAHHIIPWDMWDHPLIQKLAKTKNNFHLNERYNGIPLTSLQHAGSHANYNSKVFEALEKISKKNLSDDDAFREVKNLIDKITTSINKNGNTSVNNLIF